TGTGAPPGALAAPARPHPRVTTRWGGPVSSLSPNAWVIVTGISSPDPASSVAAPASASSSDELEQAPTSRAPDRTRASRRRGVTARTVAPDRSVTFGPAI